MRDGSLYTGYESPVSSFWIQLTYGTRKFDVAADARFEKMIYRRPARQNGLMQEGIGSQNALTTSGKLEQRQEHAITKWAAGLVLFLCAGRMNDCGCDIDVRWDWITGRHFGLATKDDHVRCGCGESGDELN